MAAIASLPWYPFDSIRAAQDAFWCHLRDELKSKGLSDAPDRLSDPRDYRSHWASPHLLLSQCCGYHIATEAQELRVVAAPEFMLEDVPAGHYRSLIVKRQGVAGDVLEDFLGRRAAYNEDQSYSGHTALLCAIPLHLLRPGFFEEMIPTGSHYESMKALADGRADVAAIDEISYSLIAADCPDLVKNLRVISKTQSAEAPPYVTSPNRREEADVISDALVEISLTEEVASLLESMRIRTIVDATNEDYLPLAKQIGDIEGVAGNLWGDGRTISSAIGR